VLLLIAASGLTVSHVQAQGSQRPRRHIELSETNSAEILTNLDLLTTSKEGAKPLEDQLKLLREASPGSSLERFNAPYMSPTMSRLPNKAIKDLLDQRRNWSFTPEELNAVMSSSDSDALSTFTDDKQDSKDGKKSSLQQFYDALKRQSAKREKTDQTNDKKSVNSSKSRDLPDADTSNDDSKLPPGIRDKAQKLRETVNEDSSSIFSPTRAHSTFENFFGLSDSNPNPDALGGSKSSMESFIDQFKKTLDAQSSGPSMDPALKALIPGAPMSQPGISGLGSLPSTAHELTASTPGNLNSVLSPTLVPDMNATALNQWNPMYAAPTLAPPPLKFTPPTPVNMQFPRRSF
jgi:hypothetical protein